MASNIDKESLFELCLAQSRADRAVKSAVNRALEKYELSSMEWLLLSVVNTGGGNGLSMTAAATALNITLAQTNALAVKLVKRRLIRQRTQKHDRRTRHIIITAKGKYTLERSRSLLKRLQKYVASEFSAEEIDTYRQSLERISHAILAEQPAAMAGETIIQPSQEGEA
jgi:DNA-binding MarR family transcriptional regulator